MLTAVALMRLNVYQENKEQKTTKTKITRHRSTNTYNFTVLNNNMACTN